MIRRSFIVAMGLTVLLSVSACSSGSESLAEQYRDGSSKGYVAGDGTIVEFAPEERGEIVSFEGVDQSGQSIRSSDYLGQVVVLNFWYAGCAPCRAEAPVLNEVAASFVPGAAAMLGVNVRDQAETAIAFQKKFDVTFPSIIDTQTGSVQLAFAGKVPANAVPTTLVLDEQGRVAARILGELSDASILTTIVDDVAAENE